MTEIPKTQEQAVTEATRQKFFDHLTAKYQVAIVSPVKTPPKRNRYKRGRPPGSKNKPKAKRDEEHDRK
jgi:hypothetical protein